MAGEVVGITTLHVEGGENLNFAIPINDAKHLLLAKSAKIQNLPNESVEAKSQLPDATPSGNLSARDYYQQLYDAGGFFKSIPTTTNGEPEVTTVPSADYVCFDDKVSGFAFFTFRAMSYDEAYAIADSKWKKIIFQKDWAQDPEKVRELSEATNTMEVIQKRLPYVGFLPDELMNGLGAETPELQNYFRHGGRILEMHLYSRGVNTGTEEYHWNGHSWVYQFSGDPNALFKFTYVYELFIEPATMRYTRVITIDDGSSTPTAAVPSSGSCEKIP